MSKQDFDNSYMEQSLKYLANGFDLLGANSAQTIFTTKKSVEQYAKTIKGAAQINGGVVIQRHGYTFMFMPKILSNAIQQ